MFDAKFVSATTVAVAITVLTAAALYRRMRTACEPKLFKSNLTTPQNSTIFLCKAPQKSPGVSPSPACCKLEALLIDYEIPYRVVLTSDFSKSPNRKIPFVHYRGEVLADSHFIIQRLIRDGLVSDPDANLTTQQRVISFMTRLATENSLYSLIAAQRWADDTNWLKTKLEYFSKEMPAPVYAIVPDYIIRPKVLSSLDAIGITRYSRSERDTTAQNLFDHLDALLGNQDFFFGSRASLLDYSVFGLLANIQQYADLTPALYQQLIAHDNLVRYLDRRAKWSLSNA